MVFSTVYATSMSYSGIPYMDEWNELTAPEILDHLFAQHNEHRIVLPRLFLILDKLFFSGSNILILTLSLVFQLWATLLLIYVGWKNNQTATEQPFWIVGIVLAFLFSLYQSDNFFLGANLAFILVNLFAVSAFLVFAFGKNSWVSTIVAAALGTAAAFSFANGMVVFPVLIVMAFAMRQGWLSIASLLTVFALVLALYLYGYRSPSNHSDPLQAVHHLSDVVRYTLTYLGAPIATHAWIALDAIGLGDPFNDPKNPVFFGLTIAVGLCGCFLMLFYGYQVIFRRRAFTPAHYALWAVMLFAFGTACLTALGRINFATAQAFDSRYGTSTFTFWAAALLLVWGARSLIWNSLGQIVPFIATGLVVILACEQPAATQDARAWRDPKLEAKTAILARANEPDALRKIFPDPSYVAAHIPMLREARLAPFNAEWANWLGTPLNQHVQIADPGRCIGWFDAAEHIPSTENVLNTESWRVRGWAWDVKYESIVEKILIVADNGDVVGYALTRNSRPDVIANEKSVTDLYSGWAGHAVSRRDSKIFAYGLLDDDHTACLLQGSHSVDPR